MQGVLPLFSLEYLLANSSFSRGVLTLSAICAALSEVSVFPGSPFFRELRTTTLNYVKTTLSAAQLLALPCASVAPILPEIFQRGPTAQLWENLRHNDSDSLIITLSLEENTGNITHLFMWRDGGFWLHSITRTEQTSFSPSMIADFKGDDLLGESEVGSQYQVRHWCILNYGLPRWCSSFIVLLNRCRVPRCVVHLWVNSPLTKIRSSGRIIL